MTTDLCFLGIDVAKKTLAASLIDGQGNLLWSCPSLSNTPKAIARLLRQARTFASKLWVAFEATGPYSRKLERGMANEVEALYRLNPRVLKRAVLDIARTKTDKADSLKIATFLRHFATLDLKRLKQWEIGCENEAREELRLLASDYRSRVHDLGKLSNRCEALRADGSKLATELERNTRRDIEYLQSGLESLKKRIIAAAKALDTRSVELLSSITGIGELSAAVIIACVGDMTRFDDVDQLKGFLGLYPVQRSSGQWQGRAHLARHGNSLVRYQLYNCARSASHHNPLCAPLYRRLKEKGKSGQQALVAVIRKLVHIIYGVLKRQTMFDPKSA